MYLDDIAAEILRFVPKLRIPEVDADGLFRFYAVLLRAKGETVTQSDVHDAWSAWMVERDSSHEALIEYEGLDETKREQDRIFTKAIHSASNKFERLDPSRSLFMDVLFPSGPPNTDEEASKALELYKIMVESSESLVRRRQDVNTFFLTINGVLLTAAGIIVQISNGNRIAALGIAVLAVAGAILCGAWRSLIISFGQLNRGKFQVINTIERYLNVAIYAAEWEALGRGENPKIYRSFTSREIWVPTALIILYTLTVLVTISVTFGWLNLDINVSSP